jgi:hypothetical protein
MTMMRMMMRSRKWNGGLQQERYNVQCWGAESVLIIVPIIVLSWVDTRRGFFRTPTLGGVGTAATRDLMRSPADRKRCDKFSGMDRFILPSTRSCGTYFTSVSKISAFRHLAANIS